MASILDLISAVLIEPPPLWGRAVSGDVRTVEAVFMYSSFTVVPGRGNRYGALPVSTRHR
jgi:hypothetical protein